MTPEIKAGTPNLVKPQLGARFSMYPPRGSFTSVSADWLELHQQRTLCSQSFFRNSLFDVPKFLQPSTQMKKTECVSSQKMLPQKIHFWTHISEAMHELYDHVSP